MPLNSPLRCKVLVTCWALHSFYLFLISKVLITFGALQQGIMVYDYMPLNSPLRCKVLVTCWALHSFYLFLPCWCSYIFLLLVDLLFHCASLCCGSGTFFWFEITCYMVH